MLNDRSIEKINSVKNVKCMKIFIDGRYFEIELYIRFQSALLFGLYLTFVARLSPSLSFATLLSPYLSFAALLSPSLSFAALLSPSLSFAALLSPPLSFAALLSPNLSFVALLSPSLSFAALLDPFSSFYHLPKFAFPLLDPVLSYWIYLKGCNEDQCWLSESNQVLSYIHDFSSSKLCLHYSIYWSLAIVNILINPNQIGSTRSLDWN